LETYTLAEISKLVRERTSATLRTPQRKGEEQPLERVAEFSKFAEERRVAEPFLQVPMAKRTAWMQLINPEHALTQIAVGRRQKLIQALKIDRILFGSSRQMYSEPVHFAISKLLFIHDWLIGGYELLRKLISPGVGIMQLKRSLDQAMDGYAKVSAKRGFLGMLNYMFAASTPLARRIVSAMISYTKSGSSTAHSGARVNITSTLGAGKTTFAFWSCVSALLYSGFFPEEALRITKSLFVKDLDELVNMLREATELAKAGGFVPFLVLDDAVASGLSKYEMVPTYGDPNMARLIVELNRMLTVSREGVGVTVIIGHVNMLPRPLREHNVDLTIEGISIARPSGVTATVWVARMPMSSRGSSARPVDMTATIIPIIRMPEDIYAELESVKLEKRLRILEEITELYEKIKAPEEGGEPEEGSEEPEEGGEE